MKQHNFIPVQWRTVLSHYGQDDNLTEVREYRCTKCGKEEFFPERFSETECGEETSCGSIVLFLSVLLVVNGIIGLLSLL